MSNKITEPERSERVKRYLKAELKRAGLTYDVLAERLREAGLEETTPSVANKLSRGTFPATFFFAVAKAIGLKEVKIDDI